MFTGIVEEIGKVSLARQDRLSISANTVAGDLKLGDSIAVNGVCLTVSDISGGTFSVDVMPETLRRTNLGSLKSRDEVNLERPLSPSGRLGGHLVQGHIDGTARVAGVSQEAGATLIRFETESALMRYIVEKGFVAVDGISLTVTGRDERSFGVSIVDFTKKHTNLKDVVPGRVVNIEIDIIAKYVEQFLKPKSSGVTI